MRESDKYEKGLLESIPQNTLQKELRSLAIKITIIAIGSWLALYVFEFFIAPIIGLKHFHIQIAGNVITLTVALVIITSIRRVLHKFLNKMHPQFSSSISFFIIIVVALITGVLIMYQWNINPQVILVGGGVAVIVVGLGVSTIIGNILSGVLMLATFPAKIGDSVSVVGYNVRGKIEEITMLYTKIMTDQGTEYVVPNNAIIQGNITLIKEDSWRKDLPFTKGDHIELKDSSGVYSGTVIKITPNFSTILGEDKKKETIFANATILSGQFVITKDRME